MDKLLTAVAHPLAPGPNPLHAAAHYAALPLHFAHSLCPCTLWPFFLLKYISIILFLRHKPEFLPLHLKPQRGKPQVSSGEAWESPIHSPRSPPGPFLLTFLFPFTIPLPFILVLLHSGPMSSPKTFQPSTASALHFYSTIAAPFTSPTRNQSPQSPATLLYPALPPPHLCPLGPTFGSQFDPNAEQPSSEGVPVAGYLRGRSEGKSCLHPPHGGKHCWAPNVPFEVMKFGCDALCWVSVMPWWLGTSMSRPRGQL